ncbi:hypothetical protein AYI68_g3227 [Smittium mucronatum]|uniref:Uncharacterized protein n=1 Tax=Smittium mucronatum TaxID=133383 RepID=A0A1R0H0H6_9FUNG|nr:hypothetical protein AYI68_g3227 [Smittium mucronatum]
MFLIRRYIRSACKTSNFNLIKPCPSAPALVIALPLPAVPTAAHAAAAAASTKLALVPLIIRPFSWFSFLTPVEKG